MAKALQIEGMANTARELERKVDRFKYNHDILLPVAQPLATALNHLATVRANLDEATRLQALEELKQREEDQS